MTRIRRITLKSPDYHGTTPDDHLNTDIDLAPNERIISVERRAVAGHTMSSYREIVIVWIETPRR